MSVHRREAITRPVVLVYSFGYTYDVPEADIVVDVRPHLTNPYRLPDFHDLSGLDAPTRDFVLGQPAAQKLLSAAAVELEELLSTGAPVVRVGVGCTGGNDRSVAIAGEFAARIVGQAASPEVVLRHLHVHLRAGADRRARP